MNQNTGRLGRILGILFIWSLGFSFGQASDKISRVDLYDAQGSELLHTIFNYKGTINTGRSIYNPRGVLLQTVSFKETNGVRTQENYSSGNGELQYFNLFTHAGTNKTHTLYDPFNNPLSQSTYDTNPVDKEYQVHNAKDSSSKLVYSYHAIGKLDKVHIYNNKGTLSHYATVSYSDGVSVSEITNRAPLFHSIVKKRGLVILGIHLKTPKTLKVDVYNVRGRKLGSLKDKFLEKGSPQVQLDVNHLGATREMLILRIYFKGSSTYLVEKVVK